MLAFLWQTEAGWFGDFSSVQWFTAHLCVYDERHQAEPTEREPVERRFPVGGCRNRGGGKVDDGNALRCVFRAKAQLL